MKDSQRLEAVLLHLKTNKNKFAQSIGLDRATTIYDIIKGKYGISANLAKSVTNVFNEINYDWLLTGDGEMLKAQNLVEDSQVEYEKVCYACKEKDKIIEAQKKTIEAQSKTIEAYENTIELQKQLIESFKPDEGPGQKRKAG